MGFTAPLETQLLTWTGSVGPGAMSGRSVPAAMPLAIWLVESRLVVMWTLMPLLVSNGASTSLKALSSAPPQAVHTVTSVLDAPPPPELPPPPPHAATRKSALTQSAIPRELRLAKTSAIACSPPYPDPGLGRKCPPSCCLLPGPTGARVRRQTELLRQGTRVAKTNVRLSHSYGRHGPAGCQSSRSGRPGAGALTSPR